jgi:hypothetical protein
MNASHAEMLARLALMMRHKRLEMNSGQKRPKGRSSKAEKFQLIKKRRPDLATILPSDRADPKLA